jgi:TRAP-type C4-dicarboxylate transport system permease large subunit
MSMDEVTRGVLPFIGVLYALLLLLVLFPALVIVPMRWFAG